MEVDEDKEDGERTMEESRERGRIEDEEEEERIGSI